MLNPTPFGAIFGLFAIACGPPATPSHSPARIPKAMSTPGTPEQFARPGAQDCGVGNDSTSDEAVYRCGARAIVANRAFHCRFQPWPNRYASTPVGELKTLLGYSYDRRGSLKAVFNNANTLEVLEVWQRSSGAKAPIRVDRGIRPPNLSSLDGIQIGGAVLSVPTIVDMEIDENGKVIAPRIISEVAAPISPKLVSSLQDKQCGPALAFGVPIRVFTSAAFIIDRGHLKLYVPPAS